MGHGFMGMMLKQKCNHRSGGEKVSLNKKSTDESVKDQGFSGCDF
jgi:hypothetical protein